MYMRPKWPSTIDSQTHRHIDRDSTMLKPSVSQRREDRRQAKAAKCQPGTDKEREDISFEHDA